MRLDKGQPRLQRRRVFLFNLTIQLVLAHVLPREQRASRVCVLSKTTDAATRRRAVTTVLVWAHVFFQRSAQPPTMFRFPQPPSNNVQTDQPEEEPVDPLAPEPATDARA